MKFDAKPPQEDPETKARRERAEKSAEEDRLRSIRRDASAQTRDLLRQFGSRAALSGSSSLASIGTP